MDSIENFYNLWDIFAALNFTAYLTAVNMFYHNRVIIQITAKKQYRKYSSQYFFIML